jgi:rhodanese-related sulfurtransferase
MVTSIGRGELLRISESDEATVVNVLPVPEFEEEHLPGSINIPLRELTAEALSGLARDQPVVVYCHDDL